MNGYRAQVVLLGVALSTTANAHHAANAAFTTNMIEVEGTVTEFNFTNPHVNIYFDVVGEAGDTISWMASGSAANLLRRQGWTAETIQSGQYLRISGREARNGVPMVTMGSIIELDSASHTLVRNVQGESNYEDAVGAAPLALKLGDGRPNFSGAWTMGPRGMGMGMGGGMGGPPGDRTPPPFNDTGVVMQAEFDPIRDPAVNCEPPGLVRQAGFTPHPVRVTQNDDHVVLEYEEYGGRRVVYLDDREPDTAGHSNLGHSVARYEGDTLVIHSSQLFGNYTSPQGNPLSDRTTTVETYRRMDDPSIGAALALEMVITDAGHLTAPWTLRWLKYYTPGYDFIEVDCRVPFTYGEAGKSPLELLIATPHVREEASEKTYRAP